MSKVMQNRGKIRLGPKKLFFKIFTSPQFYGLISHRLGWASGILIHTDKVLRSLTAKTCGFAVEARHDSVRS
jgi:hypothetical protein